MPLHQRPSGTGGRGTQSGSSGRPGSSSNAGPTRHSPPTDRPDPVLDDNDRLLAALNTANTQLNKANEEKDKFRALYENTNKRLAESSRAQADLKIQAQAFRDENILLREQLQRQKEDCERVNFENHNWDKNYTELKARYDNLVLRYNATSAPSPTNPMAAPLPERPKVSRTTSKRESKDQREDRGRAREKRERKEAKDEKERLSRRFEGRPDDRRPPTNHRNSFIEGWGPGGRSASANPGSRSFNRIATGRMQGPAVTPSQQAAYSSVPRTTNPMSPGLYSSSGSGSSAVYDEEFEDGNYHAYPITR